MPERSEKERASLKVGGLMSKSKGRPNKYLTNVEPYLHEIEKMLLTMTEKQVAQSLGVGYSAWKEYKNKYPALMATIKKGRGNLVAELKSTLIKKAKGFQYEERKVIKEHGIVTREEITTKASLPDVAALNLLLKNYDKENWANDPQTLDIRKKELELKEKQVNATVW